MSENSTPTPPEVWPLNEDGKPIVPRDFQRVFYAIVDAQMEKLIAAGAPSTDRFSLRSFGCDMMAYGYHSALKDLAFGRIEHPQKPGHQGGHMTVEASQPAPPCIADADLLMLGFIESGEEPGLYRHGNHDLRFRSKDGLAIMRQWHGSAIVATGGAENIEQVKHMLANPCTNYERPRPSGRWA